MKDKMFYPKPETRTPRPEQRLLRDIIAGTEYKLEQGGADIQIDALAYDSRECSPGTLFFCIQGFNVNGHDFVPEALARGAHVLVVERPVEAGPETTVIRVADSREAMGLISAAFFGRPTEKLHLTGVTGTNGKTSIAFLIDALHGEMGVCKGLLGTVENRIADEVLSVKRTTPESMDLQALLARMADKGCNRAVMEVSSHAVSLKRISGCVFKAGVFTNLTQDHLDFHKDLNDYFEAKKGFFTGYLSEDGVAVLNSDDPAGRAIARDARCRVVSYAVDDAGAEVRAENVRSTPVGIAYRIVSKFMEPFYVESHLMGGFNVYNTLALAAYGISQGTDTDTIKRTLKNMKGVPGRFERINEGQPYEVFVDYAHTPDGLLNILRSAREICKGRLIVVFGAGGDRDRTKRPLMGAAAAENADFVIVTSDNPRTEDPDRIIDQIVQGMEQALAKVDPSKRFKYMVEPDRFAAVRRAIETAKEGDVIVVAGKGHETYQIFKDRTIFFDDREVARNLIRERMADGSRAS